MAKSGDLATEAIKALEEGGYCMAPGLTVDVYNRMLWVAKKAYDDAIQVLESGSGFSPEYLVEKLKERRGSWQ